MLGGYETPGLSPSKGEIMTDCLDNDKDYFVGVLAIHVIAYRVHTILDIYTRAKREISNKCAPLLANTLLSGRGIVCID